MCEVDLSECLRLGADAPGSEVTLNVDPASLTEEQRAILASEAQRRGGVLRYPHPIAPATVAGLVASLDRYAEAARRASEEERRRREQADAEIAAALAAEPVRWRTTVYLYADGGWTSQLGRRFMDEPVLVRHVDFLGPPEAKEARAASPEAKARWEAEYERAKQAAVEAALPGLRAELEAELRQRAEAEAKRKAEYDVLYGRLPATLRARAEAGRATKEEIQKEIGALMRADAYAAGFPEQREEFRAVADRPYSWRGWDRARDLSSTDPLTDAQWEELQRLEAGPLPEGARIRLVRVWDEEEIPCEKHEEYDPDCEDCDVISANVRVVARVEWSRGGVSTYVIHDLGRC